MIRACSLWLILLLLVAGCSAHRSLSEPASAPTSVPAPISVPTATIASVDTAANQGGVTDDEPADITAPPAAVDAPPTATVALAATPPASASPAVADPAAAVETATALPPTATLPPVVTPRSLTTSATGATRTPAAAATRLITPTGTARPAATPGMGLPSVPATGTVQAISKEPYPLQIEVMRQQSYPGSAITVEQTLDPGANYQRYLVSYISEGNKIYALMTVPNGEKPATGWPVIIFNHGYIPPAQYQTTERYVAYVDALARSGYIVFKSDYRGHGNSEGNARDGGYGSPGYTTDVLNALASMKAYKDADPNRIGMWGHSMGGSLTLRAMVVSRDIKAGVIWGGVVAPYPDIFARGNNPLRNQPPRTPRPEGEFGRYGRNWRLELTTKYGTPEQNPAFWASISPNSYLADISGPLQLHHSVTDEEVPVAASQKLAAEMQAAGKPVELFTYPGDNHNINGNFGIAMQRTIAFFNKYVKGGSS